MNVRLSARRLALAVVSVVAMAWVAWPVGAHQAVKKPLGYDVYDYWKSIGGARLSDDGQWFAYSLTSQAEDPELVVRNVGSGQEFRQPRGTGPQFTPDGKFLLFTIPPPRSETENQAGASPTPSPTPAAGAEGQPAAANRNSIGIMALPGGQVTTVEQIASFRLPTESSTWVALQKGRAGGAGRGAAAPAARAVEAAEQRAAVALVVELEAAVVRVLVRRNRRRRRARKARRVRARAVQRRRRVRKRKLPATI